jgi:hypothetical protein
MVVTASITGLFKTLLIILGAFVLLRFLGQVMMAKRNMEEDRRLNRNKRAFDEERERKLKNFGKISILSRNSRKARRTTDAEDADYEEVN